ncbi:MAG: YARHG domain-containing protein [Muribaculaceae bacterium]|nr:YARHG domain-containing protein [Muribaculaceae bacterium]
MFCGNCGAKNEDNARFCHECGSPLVSNVSQNTSQNVNQSTNQNANQMIDKIKAMPKKVLIGGCLAVVALVVIVFVVVNAKSTINLNNYVKIEADGYDGYGTIKASIDWDAIKLKYSDKVSFTGQAQTEFGGLFSSVSPIDLMEDYISIELAETSKLSNGDVVEYTWNVADELSTMIKCKLKYKDSSYNVLGLTEIGIFDAFSGLEITYEGIAPNGYANIAYNGSELDYYDFRCDKTDGLSNGDKIIVSIDEGNLEYYARNLGKVPDTLERKYIVEGLRGYVTAYSEIDNDSLAAMQQQASDVYNAYAAQRWDEGAVIESFTYIGDYFLTLKDKNSWGDHNRLYLVYKAQVRNHYADDGETFNDLNGYYWYISFHDIMVEPDGSITVDITNYNTPSESIYVDSGISYGWFGTKRWEYYGYWTLDDLYKVAVTSAMDVYNHEDNIDESVAPETVTVAEEEPAASTDYIFPDSDSRILSKEELTGLSADECKIARNEIYARHGRKFKDEELQSYFNACDWYEGTIEPDDFQENELSEIEIANKDLIVDYEKEKGYR